MGQIGVGYLRESTCLRATTQYTEIETCDNAVKNTRVQPTCIIWDAVCLALLCGESVPPVAVCRQRGSSLLRSQGILAGAGTGVDLVGAPVQEIQLDGLLHVRGRRAALLFYSRQYRHSTAMTGGVLPK